MLSASEALSVCRGNNRRSRETCRKLVTRREMLVVTCTKGVTGDGETWLNYGYILKIKPIRFVDRSDVACERRTRMVPRFLG